MKLGILKETRKASDSMPAPKSVAIIMSRTNPRIRDRRVSRPMVAEARRRLIIGLKQLTSGAFPSIPHVRNNGNHYETHSASYLPAQHALRFHRDALVGLQRFHRLLAHLILRAVHPGVKLGHRFHRRRADGAAHGAARGFRKNARGTGA